MTRPIPQRTRLFFELFVDLANEDDPFNFHDMDRFYHFIWAAHSGRAKLSEHDVKRHLIDREFAGDVAEELADTYASCRAFLDARQTIPYIPDWKRAGA